MRHWPVRTESGETVPDPSEDMLHMMAGELTLPDNSYLTVERPDTADQWSVVICRQPNGKWEAEYRYVARNVHELAVTDDLSWLCRDATSWPAARSHRS